MAPNQAHSSAVQAAKSGSGRKRAPVVGERPRNMLRREGEGVQQDASQERTRRAQRARSLGCMTTPEHCPVLHPPQLPGQHPHASHLSSWAQPKHSEPHMEPVSQTQSRVHSARGTMSALPHMASRMVARDRPCRLAGSCGSKNEAGAGEAA